MYPEERRKAILEIIKKDGYIKVEEIISKLHYSVATINRDLNILQNQKLIKRSYGGVTYGKGDGGIALPYRYNISNGEKKKIAQAAAKLVENGDTIFIDAATTTQAMAQFLTEKKNITVITNNLSVAMYLGEYGIRVKVLGGEFLEAPYFIYSEEAVEMARRYRADKFFFSVKGLLLDGRFCVDYASLHNVMLRNSDKAYCLADDKKIGVKAKLYLDKNLDDITGIISDFLPQEIINKFPNTEYIVVGK